MSSYKRNIKHSLSILLIAYPIIIAQVFDSLTLLSNTYFATNIGTVALATHSVVVSLFFLISSISWGLLAAGSIVISHHYGAEAHDRIRHRLHQLMVIAFLITIPSAIITWFAPSFLAAYGLKHELVMESRAYFHILTFALGLHNIAFVLLQLLIGTGKTRILLLISFIECAVSIFAKYVLVYGEFGFPELGLSGLGYSILISYLVFLLLISGFISLHKSMRDYLFGNIRESLQKSDFIEIVKLGWPMTASYFTEFAVFTVMSLLIGQLGIIRLSAYQLATQYLALFAMVSFSLAQATTASIGQSLGAKANDVAKSKVYCALSIGLIVQSFVLITLFLFPLFLINIDIGTKQIVPGLIAHALEYLSYLKWFLLFDCIRLIAVASLRAYKDTLFPLYVSLLCFWGVGQPVGYYLAFSLNWHGAGLWLGLIVGVVLSDIVLIKRIRRHHNVVAVQMPCNA